MKIPWSQFAISARSVDYADELTHGLYRYPAGLPPLLVRTLIHAFTKPGESVLDPFCGGGTTAIESIAHGRYSINSDLNSLACFVTQARAWPLGRNSFRAYLRWLRDAKTVLSFSSSVEAVPLVVSDLYRYAPSTHGILLVLRDSARQLKDAGARRFALLTVLRLGKLAFDCRKNPPNPRLLANSLDAIGATYSERMESYSRICRNRWSQHTRGRARLKVFCTDSLGLHHRLGDLADNVTLVLTSPPYPRVHMLYHRWQVYGRRETSLPYSLLQLNDGMRASGYTMGSRHKAADGPYFRSIEAVYRGLGRVLSGNVIVAQILAFAEPKVQLPLFCEAMERAGFVELLPRAGTRDRISRAVPHRRWYAYLAGTTPSTQEFLFIHRLDSRSRSATVNEWTGKH